MIRFIAATPSSADKRIFVEGGELRLWVDYDDVDHEAVRRELAELLNVMNRHYQGQPSTGL